MRSWALGLTRRPAKFARTTRNLELHLEGTVLKVDLRWHYSGLHLLLVARRIAHQRRMTREEIQLMTQELLGGSLEKLLTALERWFPGEFEFVGDPRRKGDPDRDVPIETNAPPEFGDLADPMVFSAEVNKLALFGIIPGAH